MVAIGINRTYATVATNSAAVAANLSTTNPLTSFGSVVALPQGGGANCAAGTVSNGFNYSDDDRVGSPVPATRRAAPTRSSWRGVTSGAPPEPVRPR